MCGLFLCSLMPLQAAPFPSASHHFEMDIAEWEVQMKLTANRLPAKATTMQFTHSTGY